MTTDKTSDTRPEDAPDTLAPSEEPTRPEPEDAASEPQGGQVGSLRHEAAQRRRQLREVEVERDALREQLTTYQRGEVERMVAERLTAPADLFLTVELADLVGGDGRLDPEKVTAAADQAVAERPHWAVTGRPNLHQGTRPAPPEPPSFGAQLKGARRRG
jgi:hypothetical protein